MIVSSDFCTCAILRGAGLRCGHVSGDLGSSGGGGGRGKSQGSIVVDAVVGGSREGCLNLG